VDNDAARYTFQVLHRWKSVAEQLARRQLEVDGSHIEVPHSVEELITLTEIRAARTINLMTEATHAALTAFAAETSPKTKINTYPSDANNSGADLNLARRLALLEAMKLMRWKQKNRRALVSELVSIKRRFVSLHHKHKAQLRAGNYVVAHEIVGQIHSVIEEFNRVADPPNTYPILHTIACYRSVPSLSKIQQRTIETYSRYPGLAPKKLSLPKGLNPHWLVAGANAQNWKKTLQWNNKKMEGILKFISKAQ